MGGLFHRSVLPSSKWHDEMTRQINSEQRSSNRLLNNIMAAPAPLATM